MQERFGFSPWVGNITWNRKRHPTPIFLPGKFHGQCLLVGYSPRGHKESKATEHTHTQGQCNTHLIPGKRAPSPNPVLSLCFRKLYISLTCTHIPRNDNYVDHQLLCEALVTTAQPVILNSCPHYLLYPGSRQLFLHIFGSASVKQKATVSNCKGLSFAELT